MSKTDPFNAPSAPAIYIASQLFGNSNTLAYQLFRTVLLILRVPNAATRMKCQLPNHHNPSSCPESFKEAFKKSWDQITDEDSRYSILDQIRRHIYSIDRDEEQLTYETWLVRHYEQAHEPWFVIWKAAQCDHLLPEIGFNPIWGILSKDIQERLLALWWRIIKCSCEIKVEKMDTVKIIKVTLPDGRPPIQLVAH